MEIKVRCRKKGDTWTIEDPGPTYVRERRVLWTFEGLEPNLVPLIAFHDNPPHGPFLDVWLTASTIAAEIGELPSRATIYRYDIVLAQWNPDQSAIVASRTHELTLEARPAVQIKVSWKGLGSKVLVDPDTRPVKGASPVEWSFDIPENVFATIDFGLPDVPGESRPMGPFAELHGRRENGVYQLTGQTDQVKSNYKYTVTLYDRNSGQVIFREDPKIDNNGDPI
jgi:hypothetical protein